MLFQEVAYEKKMLQAKFPPVEIFNCKHDNAEGYFIFNLI